MLREFKRQAYFLVAWYFRFFAHLRLRRWHPLVIVVTGSSGKTTLLNLLESQLGGKARYSHHANSAIGIPFDVLGLQRKSLTPDEWLGLFLLAPVRTIAAAPPERIYVVETDCDRPGEGRFLGSFLRPDVSVWLNATRTHSMNFDQLVSSRRFPTLEEAIAHEFGYFIEYAKDTAIVNADIPEVTKQIPRTKAKVVKLSKAVILKGYYPELTRTTYTLGSTKVTIPAAVPEESWYAVAACLQILKFLHITPDLSFRAFSLPPGRSSVLRGKKGVTIIDSSYNSNLASATAVLSMFQILPSKEKWLVISDMLEQGLSEKEEHEKLALILSKVQADRIILMGPRVIKYTYPMLQKRISEKTKLVNFETPKEVLTYLNRNLVGRETVLFKGGRFLEGVIEHLLFDPADSKNLCRREKVWQIRRKKWGL